jgi:hypothetical protein
VLLEDDTAGDPITGVKWTRKSLRQLSRALGDEGYPACPNTVRRLLRAQKFSLLSNRKQLTGQPHEQRDEQFKYIATQKAVFLAMGWPIVSVDAKKRELVGLFKNPGRTWRREAISVNLHDFPGDAIGKAILYGIYDLAHNRGVVFVGTSAETAQFAVESIAAWWQEDGQVYFPQAPAMLILCDCGGGNGYRVRLWKQQLQREIADKFDLAVVVCHYPTGASKWNPIEHRMFSLISNNWAGQPLTSYETIINYIETTGSETGFSARAVLAEKTYETGIKVSDVEMEALHLIRHPTCPQWNYTLLPRIAV